MLHTGNIAKVQPVMSESGQQEEAEGLNSIISEEKTSTTGMMDMILGELYRGSSAESDPYLTQQDQRNIALFLLIPYEVEKVGLRID